MASIRTGMRSIFLRPNSVLPIIRPSRRAVSTLPDNPDIYVHPSPSGAGHILTLLPTTPPNPRLALGTTTSLPPSPRSFTENTEFLVLLRRVVRAHAASDPLVQSDARRFASSLGAPLLSNQKRQREGGAGAANYQGGIAGGGIGGWMHVYDQRGIPAYGRIADTDDIFGSLLVDGQGRIVDGEKEGGWEENRMYRLVSSSGVMRLSPFLRDRVREALREEEHKGTGE